VSQRCGAGGNPSSFFIAIDALDSSLMTQNIDRAQHVIDAAIAIVVRDGLVLISQRKDDNTLGGYWEFPGGKCEPGETLEQCLARELREELDISATPIRALPPVEHTYPTTRLRLHPFICDHLQGEPKLIECQDCRWIAPRALRDHRFPPANEQLIEDVIAILEPQAG
jgi:mutator protein MutT